MRSGLLGLLGLVILVWSPGCCSLKRFFGSTGYYLRVRADDDAHEKGITRILVVWPSPEKSKEFDEVKSIDEAKEKVRNTYYEDCEYVDLGIIPPGYSKDFRGEITIDGQPKTLHTQCYSEHVFVFTNMKGENSRIKKILYGPMEKFDGYLSILVREHEVEVSFTPF